MFPPKAFILGVTLLVLMGSWGSAGIAWSEESMDLPIKLQFKLLIKASTYNRLQKQKDPQSLRVGIIYSGGPESEKVAKHIMNTTINNSSKRKTQFAVLNLPRERNRFVTCNKIT